MNKSLFCFDAVLDFVCDFFMLRVEVLIVQEPIHYFGSIYYKRFE